MTSHATCYFPDKSIATGYELCNSTLAGPNGSGSACCATGDICTTGGFCLNDMYYPYRGACTDKSWNSESCATECLNGEFSFARDIYPRLLDRYWRCIWFMLIISVPFLLSCPFQSRCSGPLWRFGQLQWVVLLLAGAVDQLLQRDVRQYFRKAVCARDAGCGEPQR